MRLAQAGYAVDGIEIAPGARDTSQQSVFLPFFLPSADVCPCAYVTSKNADTLPPLRDRFEEQLLSREERRWSSERTNERPVDRESALDE